MGAELKVFILGLLTLGGLHCVKSTEGLSVRTHVTGDKRPRHVS